jgi:hypothetical protein
VTRPSRIAAPLVAAVLSLAATAAAEPEDPKLRCKASYEAAQELRLAGKLRDAKEQLRICMASECSEVARVDCGRWLGEVEAATPTVVLELVDGSGQSVESVRVTLDGAPVADRLDGRPLEIDPGMHVFVFEPPGVPAIERRVNVLTGEKNRKVVARLAPPPQPAAPAQADEGWSVHPATWVLGAGSLVGFGVFAGFGAHSIVLEECGPECSTDVQSQIDAERIVADVGLTVGAVAAAATLLVAVLTYDEGTPSGTARLTVGVHRRPGGALATVGGAF